MLPLLFALSALFAMDVSSTMFSGLDSHRMSSNMARDFPEIFSERENFLKKADCLLVKSNVAMHKQVLNET